jgi:hypothetical protein
MSNCPFNNEFFDLLFAGDLTDDELVIFKAHLDEDCPDCEDFISSLDEDNKDALWGFIYTSSRETNEEFSSDSTAARDLLSRIEADFENEQKPSPPKQNRFSLKKWKVLPLAASFMLISSIAYYFITGLPPEYSGTKGGDVIIDGGITLNFLVVSEDVNSGGPAKITGGEVLGAYSSDQGLVFRYEVDALSWVYLFRMGEENKIKMIYPFSGYTEVPSGPGNYYIQKGEDPAVFKLTGLSGKQTFCAVASPEQVVSNGDLSTKVSEIIVRDQNLRQSGRFRKDGIYCLQIEITR